MASLFRYSGTSWSIAQVFLVTIQHVNRAVLLPNRSYCVSNVSDECLTPIQSEYVQVNCTKSVFMVNRQ